jgi:uncharacterized protein (DUF983 family)
LRPPLGEMLTGAWRCRCPRCHKGELFERWPNKVLPRCLECGLPYYREQGYFVGGMVITYGLSMVVLAAVSLIVFFILPDKGLLSENGKMIVWFVGAVVLTLAFLRRSYSLWISVDYWVEPWGREEPR